MSDPLDLALDHLDRVAMLDSFDAVLAAAEHARSLPEAAEAERAIAHSVFGASLRFRKPRDVVERLLRAFLDIEPPGWRRLNATGAAAARHPELLDVHLSEHVSMEAQPQSDTRARALAISRDMLRRKFRTRRCVTVGSRVSTSAPASSSR